MLKKMENIFEVNYSDSSSVDSTMDAQLRENTFEDSPFFVCSQHADGQNDKCTLLAIIVQCEKKNLICPLTAEILKNKCREIKHFHEIDAFLIDLSKALKPPNSLVTDVYKFKETVAKDMCSETVALESELQVVTDHLQHIEFKYNEIKDPSVKVQNLETLQTINAVLEKKGKNMEEELSIMKEKRVNAEELLKNKTACESKVLAEFREIFNTEKVCKDCCVLNDQLTELQKEYDDLIKQKIHFTLCNKELESKEEDSRREAEQLEKQYKELKHKKYRDFLLHRENMLRGTFMKKDQERKGKEDNKYGTNLFSEKKNPEPEDTKRKNESSLCVPVSKKLCQSSPMPIFTYVPNESSSTHSNMIPLGSKDTEQPSTSQTFM